MKIRFFGPMVIMLFGVCWGVAQADTVKLAINAPRGSVETAKWQALVKQLGVKIGKDILIMPYAPAKITEAIGNGDVDFALVNPVSAVIVAEKYHAQPLATVKAQGTPYFAGVIIASQRSGIMRVADLKGKKVMGYQIGTSAGGYVFQAYHLMKKGIDPHKDFALFKEARRQDEIPLEVELGMMDAGLVRSGVLESMAKAGLIDLRKIVVLDQKHDELPHLHSTNLYPEWFLMATEHVDAALAEKLKAAALAVKAKDPATKEAGIDGFVEAISLDGLKKALKTLKLSPYENEP
jgi:ABC-type phosphate/phosphonate transport system substrate-binding protein